MSGFDVRVDGRASASLNRWRWLRWVSWVLAAGCWYPGFWAAELGFCAGAAGDMVLTLTVTAKGRASIAQALNDQCEATFTARLLFRPDPVTGRYSRPVQEEYTMAASGGGNILDIETWTYTERQPSPGSASLTYRPSEGKAVIGWSYVDDHIRSEPEAGQGSERMARTAIKQAEDDLIMKPDCGIVTFTPNAAEFTAFGSVQGEYSDMFGSAQMTATYSLRRQGEELDAVIIPPKNYAAWMPTAGPDATTPGTNPVVVAAELRLRGTKAPPPVRKARFRFELLKGSREPGICLNDPPKSEAKTDYDLQFGKSKGIEPTNEKQRYETEDLTTESSAIVLCYDYGAAARLKVTAITDMGEEIEAFREDDPGLKWLDLPEDKNENRVADGWERGQGTWGEVEEPAWDEADDPKDQDGKGDGISLYERYRGFRFGRDHERLEAKKKHVFIYDPDGLVHLNLGSVMSFEAASELRVRFVENRTWTGNGTSGSQKRIVNFNTSGFGHAVDQHALHLRLVSSKSPTMPKDYQDMWKAKYGHPDTSDISKFYGMTYADVTGVPNMESPGGILVIELYPWGTERICRRYVRYHTLALPRFAGYDQLSDEDRERMLVDVIAEADDYIQSHSADWEEQNLLYLLAGATHELGHGVSLDDLVPPNTGGPWSCFMRYIALDFPRNADDRMELTARWRSAVNRPRQFCHDPTATVPGKGCYEQVHVTDRKPPAPALHQRPAAAAKPPLVEASRWLAAPAGLESPLNLEAFLEWEDVLAGDPLRFTVRLSWPSMMNAWSLDLHTRGTQAATPTFPTIANSWPDGLRLELARTESDGRRTVIVPSGTWAESLRSLESDPTRWEQRLGVRSREFLTDPVKVGLASGAYVLTVAWDGRGLTDAALLPTSGMVVGGELRFQVRASTEPPEQAAQQRRLAFRAWDRQEWEIARQRGREALALAPEESGRDALDAALVMASASLSLGDLAGAHDALQGLSIAPGFAGDREVQLLARTLAEVVAPSLRLEHAPLPGAAPILGVYGHLGQTYEVEVSTNLTRWVSVDRRTLSRSPYSVADPRASDGAVARFYRVVWRR